MKADQDALERRLWAKQEKVKGEHAKVLQAEKDMSVFFFMILSERTADNLLSARISQKPIPRSKQQVGISSAYYFPPANGWAGALGGFQWTCAETLYSNGPIYSPLTSRISTSKRSCPPSTVWLCGKRTSCRNWVYQVWQEIQRMKRRKRGSGESRMSWRPPWTTSQDRMDRRWTDGLFCSTFSAPVDESAHSRSMRGT